jgi:methionine-rich copper-binding protein CopC
MVVVPADGAVLRESPREIRIQFTEGIELEFSRIDVKNAAGEKMNAGNLRRIADDTVTVAVKALGPGTYRIEWQVLSVDTHVTEGVLRFTVSGGK